MRVLVVGAGVSGLTCALALAEAGYTVSVAARDLPLETTSAVAAAVWYPPRDRRDPRLDRWLPMSLDAFRSLADDPSTGVTLRGGIELFHHEADDTWWRDVLPGFRRARADELPPGYGSGFVAEGVPVIEMPVYLPWLEQRLRRFVVTVDRRLVVSLDEAVAEADVVVNCSGLGARELSDDASMRAVRGQVVRVYAPGIDRYLLDEGNPEGVLYVYPRATDVVIGGTREEGDERLDPDPESEERMIARASRVLPSLAAAPVLSRGVGLRPARPSVRLEAEERGAAMVVHDYGHGGSGVTLSWGCARDVVSLVRGLAPAPSRGLQ